jgi:hypothetical protein
LVALRTRDLEESWLFELQLRAVSLGISTWLVDLGPYETCRVAGVVDRLRIDPRAGVIEATISDGTAAVAAQWSISRATPQLALTPGRAVVLEGVASVGLDGKILLRNPTFELASFPEVA